ncbi:MAG: Flp family type IVb pilin [Rhizobiaceae bacterium]|nr:Flp family type IVb pilin [Rhizobiaceae bacterium]
MLRSGNNLLWYSQQNYAPAFYSANIVVTVSTRRTSSVLSEFIRKFAKDERGAALIEYTILLSLITAMLVIFVVIVSDWMSDEWSDLNSGLEDCSANPNAGNSNASDNAAENAACNSAANNSN